MQDSKMMEMDDFGSEKWSCMVGVIAVFGRARERREE
jgi:hypothetical protein